MSGSEVTRVFEHLCQSLRVLSEVNYKADLAIHVDRLEGIGNLESAVSGVLNSFHRLYDVINKQKPRIQADWYTSPELATVLLIRNARHHNHGHGIRSIYSFHSDEVVNCDSPTRYLLIDFPAKGTDFGGMQLFVSWSDLNKTLRMSPADSRISPATTALVRNYLGSEKFDGYAPKFAVRKSNIFVNAIPIFTNALGVIAPLVKPHVNPSSTEAKLFIEFDHEEVRELNKHSMSAVEFWLPE